MKFISVPTWQGFKTVVAVKKLSPQFEETESSVTVIAPEANVLIWEITLVRGSEDFQDFEENFRGLCNQPLEVRAGSGRPPRIAPSAQPAGTVERWNGYQFHSEADEPEFVFDLSFDADVFLRGGVLFSNDSVIGDKLSASVVLKANHQAVLVHGLLDNIFLAPGQPMQFLSAESMALPKEAMLRAVFVKAPGMGPRTVHAVLDYFAP